MPDKVEAFIEARFRFFAARKNSTNLQAKSSSLHLFRFVLTLLFFIPKLKKIRVRISFNANLILILFPGVLFHFSFRRRITVFSKGSNNANVEKGVTKGEEGFHIFTRLWDTKYDYCNKSPQVGKCTRHNNAEKLENSSKQQRRFTYRNKGTYHFIVEESPYQALYQF